jgi:hypothetical protein
MDKRSVSRQQIFLKAQAIYDGGQSKRDCLICDISGSGARIHFDETASGVPDGFDLFIPRQEAMRRARVVWRSGTDLGVTFLT